MKRFAFFFFLIMFIAAACMPAFSKASRGWDRSRNTYYVAVRSHLQWLGGKSSRAWRGLQRNGSGCTDETDEKPGKQQEDPVVTK